MLREGSDREPDLPARMAGTDERHAMIRELQVDPVDRRILHIDFQRID